MKHLYVYIYTYIYMHEILRKMSFLTTDSLKLWKMNKIYGFLTRSAWRSSNEAVSHTPKQFHREAINKWRRRRRRRKETFDKWWQYFIRHIWRRLKVFRLDSSNYLNYFIIIKTSQHNFMLLLLNTSRLI